MNYVKVINFILNPYQSKPSDDEASGSQGSTEAKLGDSRKSHGGTFWQKQSIRTFENKHWSTFLDRELGHKWKKLVEEVGLEFGSACLEAIYGATIILSGGDPLGTARIHNLLLVLCHISLSIKQLTLLKNNKEEWWRLKNGESQANPNKNLMSRRAPGLSRFALSTCAT